jgi:hypothetical protein
VGDTKLGPLIAAAIDSDPVALTEMRSRFPDEADYFDRFVAGVRRLAACDPSTASSEFAGALPLSWLVPTSVLDALALAAGGEVRQGMALLNQIGEVIRASGVAGASSYNPDRALRNEGVRCLQIAEETFPAAVGPLEIAAPFRYIVGYPRSGNTLLAQFLSYAFAAPNYSVYPTGEARYFSRRFHERAPGHAVFVKDHVLRPEYLEDEILSPVRDGRISMVSLARYLYAEGSNPFVRRGELADFLSDVAARMPYGFWAEHTRALLDARDRGARIRLVHYDEIFGNYERLLALARELAGGEQFPRVSEEGYTAFVARWRNRLVQKPEWSEGLALPEDSFIPQNWSVGGETIDWRIAFDAPAGRRFHDLGGTEMLIRLGYETDENWWRQC